MYASDYFESAILNLTKGTSIPAQSTLYLGLFQSNPSDTGSAGTEISYTGYARQVITFSAPADAQGSAGGKVLANSATITFAEAQAAANSVQYIAVFDASTGGNMFLYGALDTELVIQAGVSPVFRAGSIKWIWTGGISSYYKVAIMNALRGTACSGFTPYMAFFNGNPDATGVEVQAEDYSRKSMTMGGITTVASGASVISNSTNVMTDNAESNWGNVNYVALCDANSAGHVFCYASLGSTYNITTGTSCGYNAGDFTLSVN